MSENIVKFYPKDAAKNPDNVLERAIGEYSEVCVIGFAKDGGLDVRASTNFKTAEILFCMDAFKHKLFSGDYDTELPDLEDGN